MHILSNLKKKREQEANTWKQSGNRAGYNQGALSDEQFHAFNMIHDPLWRYVAVHYPKEVWGKNVNDVCVLDYNSIPIAVELSQWTFPTTLIVRTPEEVRRSRKDIEIQDGHFKELVLFNYIRNIPRVTVIVFVGILHEIQHYADIKRFLELCLIRSNEVVCAVPRFVATPQLRKDFHITLTPYPNGKTYLLSVKQK